MSIIKLTCPSCGGSVVFAEGKETAYCEYCGSELHFKDEVENEQKRHEAEIAALTDRIYQLIASRQFLKAQEAANEGLLKYPYAGRLHLCLLLAEYDLNDPAQLANCGKDYTQSENYRNCVRTMTGEDRADLLRLAEENKKTVVSAPGGFAASTANSAPTAEEEARALRDRTENTTESKKARIQSIRSSGKNLIEQIKDLSYDPYSKRDIIAYMLENGPYIIHFLKPSSLIDEQGNDFLDFVESDDNLYFTEIEKLLAELDKPENAALVQGNEEYLNRAKHAVDMWEHLIDLRRFAAPVLFNGDDEPGETYIDEDCDLDDCIDAYNMAQEFIDFCADWKRSAASGGDSGRISVDQYVTEQNDLLCSYFRTYMEDVDDFISLVEWKESPAAARNFAAAAAAAPAPAAHAPAASFASAGLQERAPKEPIKLPPFLQKLDNLCYNPKKRNVKLGIWISFAAFLLLGIVLCVTAVFGWEIAPYVGVFILVLTCLADVGLISDSIKKRHEVFCPKCKAFYNYGTDIAYNEVSRYTKHYKINNNSSDRQVYERLFYNLQVDCHCHNCGAARSYTKKVRGGEAYTDGTKQYFDPNTAMDQTFANDFLAATDTRINLACWALSIVAVILAVVLLLVAAVGAADRVLPASRQGKYYGVYNGAIYTFDFHGSTCDRAADGGVTSEYYPDLKYVYYSAEDAQKISPNAKYEGKRAVVVYESANEGTTLWDVGEDRFMVSIGGTDVEFKKGEMTFAWYYADPQDYYKVFEASNGKRIALYNDGTVETDITSFEVTNYIYVTSEWLEYHIPSNVCDKAIVLYAPGSNQAFVCEYIDSDTLSFGGVYYSATGKTEDRLPENSDRDKYVGTYSLSSIIIGNMEYQPWEAGMTADSCVVELMRDGSAILTEDGYAPWNGTWRISGTDQLTISLSSGGQTIVQCDGNRLRLSTGGATLVLTKGAGSSSGSGPSEDQNDNLHYSPNSDGTYTVTGCDSATGTIRVPGSYNGGAVTAIGNFAFKRTDLTEITLPESITSIGDQAFYGCANLGSITIPAQVTSVGAEAFAFCSSLTCITIPESVTSIGESAFEYCTNLETVNWNASNCEIAASNYKMFEECYLLTTVYIGENVASIPAYAFDACGSLQSVTFVRDSHLTSIGTYAFRDCTSLTGITLPESITSIGDQAFYGCANLGSITIPAQVTSVGDAAFSSCASLRTVYWNAVNCMTAGTEYIIFGEDCTSLTNVVIGDNVQSIPALAFAGCDQLTSVVIGENVASIGEQAFALTGLQSITIPAQVTFIDDSAFSGCTSLRTVYWNAVNCMTAGTEYNIFGGIIIDEEDTTIYTSLTNVVIGDNVQSIPAHAFAYCTQLTSVVIGENVASIGTSAFYACTSLAEVYYKGTSASQWGRIQIGSDGNDSLTSAHIYYYSNSAVYDGNHWRYVQGVPTVWES